MHHAVMSIFYVYIYEKGSCGIEVKAFLNLYLRYFSDNRHREHCAISRNFTSQNNDYSEAL